MLEEGRPTDNSVTVPAVEPSLTYLDALTGMASAAALADPHKPDMPLVFVNDAFVELTGYSRDEVIGRNCRFLQGPDTDPVEVARLRKALERQDVCQVELKNYRKDGSAFWNALHVTPIYDRSGDMLYYHAAQTDVTALLAPRDEGQMRRAIAREMHHRVKNLLAVASSIVRLTARGARDVEHLAERASRRIHALGEAHGATFDPTGQDNDMADMKAIATTMLKPLERFGPERLSLEGCDTQLPIAAITPISLALHELGANAAEHGCLPRGEGRVHIGWSVTNGRLHIDWQERCETPVNVPAQAEHGFGLRAISTLLQAVGGSIDHSWGEGGMKARIELPLDHD